MDKDFLLKCYGEGNGPEAGPWNLSLPSKYLEYKITEFFENNFEIGEGSRICNIGIGAGYWDRYLSYNLNDGHLTSVDMDAHCCRQLAECLENEQNPNPIEIIHKNAMELDGYDGYFDIITLIGSTRIESGVYDELLFKAFSMLKPDGQLYYQSLDKHEKKEDFLCVCEKGGMQPVEYVWDEKYGVYAQYWKARKK